MINHNYVTLGDAIQRILTEKKLMTGVHAQRIKNSWQQIMGEMVAKHTQKISFLNGKLYITVDSSVLKNELYYSRKKIKEVFNSELGEEVIKEVVIN